MFEPNASWSLPAHLFMVSEWSARCTHARDPSSCVNALENPLAPPTRAAEPDRPPADLRLDRPHLPAAQAPRLLGLLRRQGHPARLRRRRAWSASRSSRTPGTPGIWNPLPYFDTVKARPPAAQHPSDRRTSTRRRKRGTLPAVSWVDPEQARQRAPAGLDQRRPGLRHEPDQRGHAQPGLELDRDLPRLGRLGRLLRPRRAADGRRERLRPARARRSSSARTRAAATSTTRR